MINLLEFDESASDKSATNYCNTYNKKPCLIMNCSELDQRHCSYYTTIQTQLKPIQLPHLTHFATHEGYLLLGCYKSN